MNEAQTTVRGTVITNPTTRRVGDDQVFSFRVASNTRYQDRTSGEWKTGGTLYFSANCWGRLAQRASGSICKGDGVIVHGRLLTNEYEREGHLMRDLEMRVSALGPDLSRMDVTVRRAKPDEDAMEIGSQDVDESDTDPAEDGEFVGASGL
ncbi:single-strand binding protein [Dietzia cinnamea P4]|nr:single-strand binding protein [Dietzia cinnamea P4]